jgi:tetratricopeptide (TPR) repeat protein
MHFKRLFPGILVLILLAGIDFSGCSIWSNFTTYFNLYYDAKDIFNDAEQAIKSQKKDLFASEEVAVSGNVNQQLSKVIDKCSTILQFHSNSAYVDNALLMLGKSFYYQRNYLKALRKFQELIATQPNSDLILETELWIGKTQMRLRQYDDGLSMLETVKQKASEEGEDEFLTEAFLEEIKYKIAQEDYAGAITASNDYLKQSDNDEINAEIVFELGKLYEKVNNLNDAIASFKKVFDYSPSFDTQYEAKLELGKALREAGDKDQALADFEDMISEDKYAEHFDQIDLERGKTLADLNRYDEAVDVLVKVDTTYRNSENGGLARYELGQIFEKYYQNFDSANTYYTLAARSPISNKFKIAANEKAQLFKKYINLRKSLNESLEKQFYTENPEQYKQDSVAYYDERKNIEGQVIAEQEFAEVKAKMDSAMFAQDTTGMKIDTTVVKRDSLDIYGNQVRDQFGQVITITDTVIVNPIDSLMQKNSLLSSIQTPDFEKRVKELMGGKVPPLRPDIPADSLRSLIIKDKFELGNLYFTELNIPDSAYSYYTDILNLNPGEDYTARTLYALGSYYLTKNDSVKADSLFDIIYNKYRDKSIVNAAANKLGKPLIDLNYDPAEDIYAVAEKEMLNEKYDSSLAKLRTIYNDYPSSQLAPKALYASGWILENELDLPDSAAVLYDSLKSKYPSTVYSNKIAQKVKVYDQEQRRIEKAREDSLKKIEALKLDSLARVDSLARSDSLSQSLQQEDSLKSVGNAPPGKYSEPDMNTEKTMGDTVKNRAPSEMDSLRRNGDQSLEELQKKSETKVDSLPPGKIRRKKR